MKQYLFALTVLSLFLTVLETRSCMPKNRTDRCVAYTGIFMHHLVQLVVFVTPFTKFFHTAPNYVLYIYLSMFMYVLLQNNVVNSSKSQSCVLSMYTNTKCDLPIETPLKDPLYYIGVKSDLRKYKRVYTIVVVSYIVYIGLMIHRRSYKTATIKKK